ncbi:MAG TPA: NAD(+) diphosphatase [Nocardioidaceae bacterium]|nr:NAD(+) diphosphatase [Nocardioidaceae bacterium]
MAVEFPPPFAVDIALSIQSHDRAGFRRTDLDWLDEAWEDDSTRVVVMAKGQFPQTTEGVAWQPPSVVPEGRRLFLGIYRGVPHFAVLASELDSDHSWTNLRQSGPSLSTADAGLLIHATALAEWHRAHPNCPRCGGRLEPLHGGHVLQCETCERQHFPRTDPAVIMLVTDGDRALLGRQAVWPEGRYSTLAGFVDPGESLEQAVQREVFEEVGVEVTDVTYYGNQPWPFPSSLMVGFFARAVTTEINVDGAEIEDARWISREEMKQQAQAGTLVLPGGISISRSLIEAWYGGALPGQW